MISKTSLLAGFAAGYVLGSRAGRDRYEQIKAGASRIAQNPKVQAAADQAKDAVGQQASAVVDVAKEKASSHL